MSAMPVDSRQCAEGRKDAQQSHSAQTNVWGIFRTKETLEITVGLSLGPIALNGGSILFYFATGCGGRKWSVRLVVPSDLI